MNFAGLLFILLAHYFTGKGILHLFRISLPIVAHSCLSMMLGIPILSLVPCIIQLLHIPIDIIPVAAGTVVFTGLCCIPLFRPFRRPRLQGIRWPQLYEWPFILVISAFVLYSVWKCFYFPPYSNDMLSGPELLAEYAVREKNMISSVFTVDLSMTNNYFKSPYITGLQIIYKLLVCPFGQVWLSVLFISFTVFLYNMLRRTLHPLLAGLLMLLFFAMPEPYAHTYLMLYDYSNMVFFFLGFYFLNQYLQQGGFRDVLFASLLFGLATYIRTETLILAMMTLPLVILKLRTLPIRRALTYGVLFTAIPVAWYFLCIDVFIRLFIPIPFNLGNDISNDLSNLTPFFDRIAGMNRLNIFSMHGLQLFGYFIVLFCFVLVADTIWPRTFSSEAKNALFGVAVVYFGLALIGYLLPLADLENTNKRGLLKILPLMLWYMGNSGLLLRLSAFIGKWEAGGDRSA